MTNIPSHVPLERAPGSPYANRYGATDRFGKPIANKVAKSKSPYVHRSASEQLAARSPLERAEGKRTPDPTNGDRTLSALRMAYSTPTPLRRVAKANGPLVACYNRRGQLHGVVAQGAIQSPRRVVKKADLDEMIAVYTADGTLLGVVDPEDVTPLSSGNPVQPTPAAQAAPDPSTAPVPGSPAVPPIPQPVAKSRKPLTLREKWDAQKILRRVGR